MLFVMDVLDVNWKAGAEFLKKYCALSYSYSSAMYKYVFMVYVCLIYWSTDHSFRSKIADCDKCVAKMKTTCEIL